MSIATTLNEGRVVGMRSMPGNPYDGHMLAETLEQVSILAERKPVIAIEPAIGHTKMDGHLGRSPLKGALDDALRAVMCGAGHNLRLILAKLRLLCALWDIALAELLAVWIASTRLSMRVNI